MKNTLVEEKADGGTEGGTTAIPPSRSSPAPATAPKRKLLIDNQEGSDDSAGAAIAAVCPPKGSHDADEGHHLDDAGAQEGGGGRKVTNDTCTSAQAHQATESYNNTHHELQQHHQRKRACSLVTLSPDLKAAVVHAVLAAALSKSTPPVPPPPTSSGRQVRLVAVNPCGTVKTSKSFLLRANVDMSNSVHRQMPGSVLFEMQGNVGVYLAMPKRFFTSETMFDEFGVVLRLYRFGLDGGEHLSELAPSVPQPTASSGANAAAAAAAAAATAAAAVTNVQNLTKDESSRQKAVGVKSVSIPRTAKTTSTATTTGKTVLNPQISEQQRVALMADLEGIEAATIGVPAQAMRENIQAALEEVGMLRNEAVAIEYVLQQATARDKMNKAALEAANQKAKSMITEIKEKIAANGWVVERWGRVREEMMAALKAPVPPGYRGTLARTLQKEWAIIGWVESRMRVGVKRRRDLEAVLAEFQGQITTT